MAQMLHGQGGGGLTMDTRTIIPILAVGALVAAGCDGDGSLLGGFTAQRCDGRGLGPAVTSEFAQVPPEIDGRLAEGEWSAAATVTEDLRYRSGGTAERHAMTIRFLNDRSYLYMGLTVSDEDADGLQGIGSLPPPQRVDVLEVHFDGDADGRPAEGDDVRCFWGLQYQDWGYSSSSGWGTDSHADGRGVANHSRPGGSGEYTYELAVPLNTGLPMDLATAPGMLVGIKVRYSEKALVNYRREGNGASYGWDEAGHAGWPGTQDDCGEPHYSGLRLATQQGGA